ncbi:hypothetical protein MKX01_034679 [Papaver californicum]|nr:hypothetical protein MKX01_034679 [Papaver californicum]
MKLNPGSYYIPKKPLKIPSGEDAHFIYDNTIGVADGVSGWAKHGIDSGEYSRQLMSNSLISIMEHVHLNADPVQQGLRAINVGDSGFVVLRRGCSIYHSPRQLHSFNYLYQLGKNSEGPIMAGDVIVTGTDGLFDNLFTSEIEKIILDAEEEATSRGGKMDPNKVAWTLADFALKKSLDPNNSTPFAEAEKEYNSLSKGTGGKVDDITVIFSYVS